MIVKLLTEHHLEFLSLNGGCRGSSESTHVKMSHCWKSHALAQLLLSYTNSQGQFEHTEMYYLTRTFSNLSMIHCHLNGLEKCLMSIFP